MRMIKAPASDNECLLRGDIFDALHDAVFVYDPAARLVETVNRRAEEMFGISRNDLQGLTTAALSANVPPYTRVEAREWLHRALEQGAQLFEWQARRAGGDVFWVEVNLCRAKIEGRDKVIATVRDITRRKKADEELRRSEERFRAVLGNSNDPVYCLNLPCMNFEYVSPAVEQVLGFSMEECTEGGLAFLHSRMHPEDAEESRLRMEEVLDGRSALQQVVEYRFHHKTRGMRWICDSRSLVWDHDGRAVAIIGNLRDWTLRKERDAALHARAHAALLSHLDGTSLALVESDRRGLVCSWSSQAEKLFGWSAEEVVGRHYSDWEFTHPDDVPRAEASLGRLLDRSESRNTCVLRSFTRDGRVVVCEWHNSVVLNDNGEIQSILRLAADITLEKKTEAALRSMAEGLELRSGETFFQFLCLQLAETLETKCAEVGMIVPERDRTIRTLGSCANGKVTENHSYSVVGTPCENVIKGEVCHYDSGLPELFPGCSMVKEQGVTAYMGMPLHASDGRVMGVISVSHVQPMDRRERLQAMFQIFAVRAAAEMERHQAEVALRRSEERYALAASGSTGGVWDWDIHTGGVYYSSRFRELLGYTPEEFPSHFFSWEKKMHPEDVPRMQTALEGHLERREPFCVEHRLRVKSGDYRWFEARGQALWDDEGNPYRMAGSALDIHERKLDEQRLQRLNRLHAMSSSINEAIVRIREPQALYEAAVHIAVEKGCMPMAWIGLHDESTHLLTPVASAGNHEGYLDRIALSLRADDPGGNGPARRAFRTGVHVICNDIAEDESFNFKRQALERGFRSCAAFPLRPSGSSIGVLLIYSDEKDCFRDEEVRVLASLAEDLSFALTIAQRDEERRRAVEALSENERMISTLMRNLPGAAFRCRVEGAPVVEFISEGCLELTGHDAADLVGGRRVSLISLVHPEDRKHVQDTIQKALLRQDHYELNYRILTAAGCEKWVWERGQAITSEDGVARHVEGFMTDVTEKRRMESQMLRTQRMDSIGTLAAGVAHDLNNILTPILMCLAILRTKLPQPRDISLLESLESSANRGAEMVKQILGFARGVEGQRLQLQPRKVIEEIEHLVQETFPKSIRLECEAADDLWNLEGDPTQIHQVLLNLCVNARDAMPEGGCLSLAVHNRQIDDEAAGMHGDAKPGPYICFEVRDTGVGIPAELRERIFDPFFTTKEKSRGTGLGLATTLGIVRSHRGFIELESQVESGSCFRVSFPAMLVEQPAVTVAPKERRAGNGELILVVDDESAILTSAVHVLEGFGYRAITARDGREGLATFLQSSERPAAVISDMMMPLMDGPAMIEELRKVQPDLPIVGASGLNQQMQVKVERLGVKHFLCKPYSAETLLDALSEVLSERDGTGTEAKVQPR